MGTSLDEEAVREYRTTGSCDKLQYLINAYSDKVKDVFQQKLTQYRRDPTLTQYLAENLAKAAILLAAKENTNYSYHLNTPTTFENHLMDTVVPKIIQNYINKDYAQMTDEECYLSYSFFNDREAANSLYSRLRLHLVEDFPRKGRGDESEDRVQMVLAKVVGSIRNPQSSYKPEKGLFKEWMGEIVKNTRIDAQRKRKRDRSVVRFSELQRKKGKLGNRLTL